MMPTTMLMPASGASPWLPRSAVIDEITLETPGVQTYRLRLTNGERPNDYAFQSGQFNMLYLPGFGEAAISMSGRPPTVSGAEPQLGWVHTIRQAGQVTSELAGLQVGDSVAVRGPYGKPWPIAACGGCDIVLMAGGIGLAPLRPVIYELLNRRSDFGRLVLLYGARMPEGLLYTREYDAWTRAGLEIITTVDRATAAWKGNVGVVPLLIDRVRLPLPAATVVLSCGPEVMMRYAALGALNRGIPASQVWVSLERHMQCAVGMCGHCQLGTTLICRDGPVFSWDRVQSLVQIHDL
jgi:NAD(P)H-flavin reductase